MFRLIRPPSEFSYEADLTALGYKVDQDDCIIEVKNPHNKTYFNYFATDNERANELRKEAFHEAVRKLMAERLNDHGMGVRFLADTSKITGSRPPPEQPHVSILTTDVSTLKHKRDVILVVGDSEQECGVWAWRVIKHAGGMQQGSAVGLAAKAMAYKDSSSREASDAGDGKDQPVTMAQTGRGGEKGKVESSEGTEATTPGVIILNPGQLIYSYEEGTNMSLATWHARRRPNGLSHSIEIDTDINSVSGHGNPHQHVYTIFEHVLQQILPSNARLYILCMGDGSHSTIHALDQIVLNKNEPRIRGAKLEAISIISPKHDASRVQSSSLNTWLQTRGKSWIESKEPLNELLALPDAMIPIPSPVPWNQPSPDPYAFPSSRFTGFNNGFKSNSTSSSSMDDLPKKMKEAKFSLSNPTISEASGGACPISKTEEKVEDADRGIVTEDDKIGYPLKRCPARPVPPEGVSPTIFYSNGQNQAISNGFKLPRPALNDGDADSTGSVADETNSHVEESCVSTPTYSAGVSPGIPELVIADSDVQSEALAHLFHWISAAREEDVAAKARAVERQATREKYRKDTYGL